MRENTKRTAPPPGGSGPLGGRGGMVPGEKAKDFKGTARKLLQYLGKHKWATLFVMVLAVLSTVFSIVGPKIMGLATDELVQGLLAKISGTGGIDFGRMGFILLILAGLYVFSALFSYGQGFVMSGVTMKLTYRMRAEIEDKIHRLSLAYFDRTTHGEVLSRITNDVDTVSQSLNQSLTQIITSVTSVIGIFIMMLTISWKLAGLSLLLVPLSTLFVVVIVRKSQGHFKNQQMFLGKVNGHIEEMYGNHVVVKAFCAEDRSQNAFVSLNESLYHSAWKSNFLSGLMMPVISAASNVLYVIVCILGGYFVSQNTMTIGGIQSFIQYVRSFSQPMAQIANISNVLQQTAAAAERVFEFLGQSEEAADREDALRVSNGAFENGAAIEGNVSFEHVCFGYHEGEPVIRDFSAEVRGGQKIAIVGPTGAGKTTIVKLLMRFYDLDGGDIKIDGRSVQDFGRDDLRSLIGMVLQDTWLFHGTIEDNIRYGRLDATKKEVVQAAQAAQVHHFVKTLPEGYRMELNEEASNVSQGQKQLLTIARAILADPRILILDEATSSVDTRTERLIQTAMDRLMEGRTSFIIAHRLSTIQNADLILVMNKGDIVEQGTHEQLLRQKGFYYDLHRSQFEAVG